MIAIKVLFLLWMSLGLNCRITWRKQRQCNKAGQILENGSFETLNKTQRKYVCQADFVSNIPDLEQLTFYCDVEKNNKRRYVWRALFTGGLLYLRNVTCESKTKCSDPPWPKDMTREVTTRYVMPVPINNDTKAINDFYTGDTVKYSCKTGFILFNDQDTSSFSNGGDFDDYNRKYEKSPPSSRITAPPDTSSGFTNIICDAKGFWNGFPESQLYFGECQAIQCNATMFDDISNGNISNLKATYEFLEEMKLECEDGYRHKGGVKSAICMSPSSFSNLFLGDFGCERIQCIEPQSPGNGYLKIDHIYVNGTVSYECEPGYELIGYSKWKCQSNGKWDHDCVKCAHEDGYCPPPCLPPGAITKTSSGIYQIGDVLDFTCKSGKYYGGSTNRTCMKNRYWSGTPIDCTGTSMVDSRIGIELVSALKQISKNRTISDTVNSKTINVWNTKGVDLYLLVDISKVSTLEHMNTTLSFVYALLPELGINDGDTGTRLALIFFATNSCWMFDQHYKSDDSEGPFKSYEDVIKELKLYNNKSELQKIKQNTSDGTDIAAALNDVYDQIKTKRKLPGRKSQQVLLVISDGRSTTTDDPTDSASKLKDDFDVEIYSIVIGSLTDTKGLETMRNLASHIENEQHFFKISTDESNFKRIMSSMINRDSLNVSCGSTNPNLTSISNASENRFEVNAKKNAWPWMADLRTLHSHECGGSVIKDQWILTAAHCFDYKHITKVHLGKTNLNGLRGGNGDEYIISTIHKHEHYNKGSHKYDIALVRLSQKINRKLEVLPVCLWDKTIQSETTGVTYTKLFNKTYGVVTGWGKTNTLSKTKLAETLKQMQMEVKSSKECLENLTSQEKAHVSPGLMFCAGGEEIVDGKNQIIDACEGDSGGPFVVRHPLDERKFIQTGIVSFGFGCKQSGKYGFYTKLTEELLDWINDTIEKEEKEKEEKEKEEKEKEEKKAPCEFVANDGMMVFRKYSLRHIEKGHHTFLHGTILETYCKRGYKLLDKMSGDVIRPGTLSTCVLGNWTNTFHCVPKDCEVPEFEHVLPVEKQVYAHAQKVTFKCKDGFHFVGSMDSIESTCHLGLWSNIVTNKCTPDPCDLAILEGTSYIIDTKIYTGNAGAVYSFPNGTIAQIECKNGFKMADMNITIADDQRRYSTCIKGHWTHEHHCIPATCDLPNNLAKLNNPKRKPYIQGETISNFHCDAGYRLSSNESMTCQPDGTWSAVVKCIKNVNKQTTCHNSFDRGHKWALKAHTRKYKIALQTNNKWMSLCECKNSCVQVPNKSCVAISYNLWIGKCEGFYRGASFMHVIGAWSARVYIRI